MRAHGQGDERYAQYSNELWPLLKLLRTLEKAQAYESIMLFEDPLQNTLFTHLLQGKSRYKSELKTLSESVGPKMLPKKFLFQMDNCVKDNKNRHFLTFLSLLKTRKVFEEVKLGFLVVGHTHEDIDGCFGYLSKKLREQNNYILVYLMKVLIYYMVSSK
jgi:hypothetical protein